VFHGKNQNASTIPFYQAKIAASSHEGKQLLCCNDP